MTRPFFEPLGHQLFHDRSAESRYKFETLRRRARGWMRQPRI